MADARGRGQRLGDARWWLDVYFGRFGDHFLLAAFTIGAVTYLAGLAVASTIGFARDYVTSPPLYVGLVGIVWTGWYVAWGRRRIDGLLGEVQSAFQPCAKQYADAASGWLRRLLDWRPQLAASVLAFVASCWYVWNTTHAGHFPWFPASWSTPGPDLWAKNLILFLYAGPILVLSTSALVFIVVFTLWMRRLPRFQVIPVLPAALVLLRPLAGFGFVLSVGWSVGVSLFIVFFRPSPTLLSVALVAVLSVVAFVIFFAPQYAIHVTLLNGKRAILEAAAVELAGDVTPDAGDLAAFVERAADERSKDLAKVVESVSAARTWVYTYGTFLPLVAPVGLPAGAFVLGAVLGR